MNHHPFYHYLSDRIKKDLPGKEAQHKMSPVPLDPDVVLPGDPSETAHPSGVLIPLYPDNSNKLHVILTLRTNNIRHAGQISFPGGRRENNESLKQTALRETREEIGVEESQVLIAGALSPLYLHRTDNQITPFVGFLESCPTFNPNPLEVKEVLTVSLDTLLSESSQKREQWNLTHISLDVPFWNIHNVPLWGATAMIMSELLELYRTFSKE